MPTNMDDRGLDEEIEEEAAAWFARLRGPDARMISSDFAAWISRSDVHRQAYERMTRLFDNAAVLKQSRHHRREGRSNLARMTLLAAAALVAAVALAWGIAVQQSRHANPVIAKQLAARRGEIRTLALADGSQVTLDTGSRIAVMIGPDTRRVRLETGRARFSVAEGARPFVVEAGTGRLKTSSGMFDVAFSAPGQVTVTSLGARLEARPALRHAGLVVPVQSLAGGSALTYAAADFSGRTVRRLASHEATEWPSGWVSYRSIALSRLVAQANRYAFVPIVIDDPAISELKASGRFHLTDTDSVADNLAKVFDLTVERDDRATHLRDSR